MEAPKKELRQPDPLDPKEVQDLDALELKLNKAYEKARAKFIKVTGYRWYTKLNTFTDGILAGYGFLEASEEDKKWATETLSKKDELEDKKGKANNASISLVSNL